MATRTAKPASSDPSPASGGDTKEGAGQSFKDVYLKAYRCGILARQLEDKLASLYRAGKIVGGVYAGKGQEAFSASLAAFLDHRHGDVYAPLIRDMAGRLAFGEPILDTPRTYFGSVKGPMRGRDGNVHHGRPGDGMLAMISHLGSSISVVCGMLMARRFKGRENVVGGACIGDGASSTGACHEAMNLAGVEKLPLVLALANNHYAYSTPTSRQYACGDLVERAVGYGFTGRSVDGTDLAACLEVFREAVDAARTGQGPQLVVGSLLRLSGHGEHDDALYITGEDRNAPYGRDCLETARAQLIERGWADEDQCLQWDREITTEVDEAIATAQKEPGPEPFGQKWHALATERLNEGIYDE